MGRYKNIAVIPARGGSKRLKKKNIRLFNGKPLIHYSIEAARKSGIFDRVIVSTEDPQIIECIKNTGCEISIRKNELASDTVRVVDVMTDLLMTLEKQGDQFDFLCCLYATSPLREAQDILASYELLIHRNADFCQSVTDYDVSPFFAFDMDEENQIKRRWPQYANQPPSEKPKVVVDNGSIYWARVCSFLEQGEFQGENTVGYQMPRQRSVDIDTLMDFKMAEFFSRQMSDG